MYVLSCQPSAASTVPVSPPPHRPDPPHPTCQPSIPTPSLHTLTFWPLPMTVSFSPWPAGCMRTACVTMPSTSTPTATSFSRGWGPRPRSWGSRQRTSSGGQTQQMSKIRQESVSQIHLRGWEPRPRSWGSRQRNSSGRHTKLNQVFHGMAGIYRSAGPPQKSGGGVEASRPP